MKKRRFGAILLFGALVSGCTEIRPYMYRADTTTSQKGKDAFECQVLAAQMVPANTRVVSTPTYSSPITTTCYGNSCTTTGGTVGGGVTTVDANDGLRLQAGLRCMMDRGYQAFEMPLCTSVSSELKNRLQSQKLRPPSEGACLVNTAAGPANLALPGEK